MRFSTPTLALAALFVSDALASSIFHRHQHARKRAELHSKAATSAAVQKRGVLSDVQNLLVKTIGLVDVGFNAADAADAESQGVGVYFGTEGPYTNEFKNESPEDLIVVIWGAWGSWVNDKKPLMTFALAPNETQTVSIASGTTGAFSTIREGTILQDGQIFDTWTEFTLNGIWSTINVSREPNMSGHAMSVTTPKCKTDMDTCVFICGNGENRCMTGYKLYNCETGSQAGANFGSFEGADSGGCSGMGVTADIKTSLW